MIQEFVPYVEALDLKELGFDEPCFGYWSNYGVKEPFLLSCEYNNEIESSYIRRKPFLCKAPLYQQAFKWFRTKYGLYADIYRNGVKFNACIEDLITGNSKETVTDNGVEFEEAELECLRKLIGIVKNK
jgi:hypothetical protein